MAAAAFVLGVIGGVLGVAAGVVELAVGGGVDLLGGSAGFAWLGVGTLIVSAAGIVGASLARSRPSMSGGVQLAAMAAGFLTAGLLWIPSAVMFLVAAMCVWFGDGSAARAAREG